MQLQINHKDWIPDKNVREWQISRVCGIHVLNEGNRIEFLLAYFYDVLNGEQYTFIEESFLHVAPTLQGRFLVKIYTI